jgi:hypothetical protein
MEQATFYRNWVRALRLYYELKKKPQESLDIYELLHIQNMEAFSCQYLGL